MTTIYILARHGVQKTVQEVPDASVFENGNAVILREGQPCFLSPSQYFTTRQAAEKYVSAAIVRTATIWVVKSDRAHAKPWLAKFDGAQIDADGVAWYGPMNIFPTRDFFLNEEDAARARDMAGKNPEPLYAIPALPGDPAAFRVPVTDDRGLVRHEHSVTIDDRPTAARIAAGLCRLLLMPLGLFKRNRRGFYTGLAGACTGDLIWVKEPFTLYTPRRHGDAGFITTAADEAATTDSMRRTCADYREATRAASAMARYQSRMTLVATRVRTGRQTVPLSLIRDADARLAGFDGDKPADRMLAHLRATLDERAFGANPHMVLIEFAAYRANIDDVQAYLKPRALTGDEKTGWVGQPPAQVRHLLPHEKGAA